MAENKSRDYATMPNDQRKAFAREVPPPDDAQGEVDFPAEGPRDPDRMGRHHASAEQEYANPDNRDGQAAELDMPEHERRVDSEQS
jgi:hypothetical protein